MAGVYDVIVVGAGVVGSSTAYYLAKEGKNVLLLEQFPLPHSRGSSHGHSRILRQAYPDFHSHYSSMVPDALKAWRHLQDEAGTTIFRKVGVLSVAFDPNVMASVETSMSRAHIPYRKLDEKLLQKEFPMIHGPTGTSAMVENDAGLLYAEKGVRVLQSLFEKHGGHIRDSEQVTNITPGNLVTIVTNKNTYRGKKVVLTAGPWAGKMLKPLGIDIPVKPLRVTVLYWKERNPGEFSAERFPCLRYMNVIDGKHNLYGLPCDEYPGLFKLCLHSGVYTDPDCRDTISTDFDIKAVGDFIARYIPGLEPVPSVVERCFYTMTPDVEYVLDTHPQWTNIVIGAGFSGHGFKLAPISGQILRDLALDRKPAYDMKHFRVTRFPGCNATKANL